VNDYCFLTSDQNLLNKMAETGQTEVKKYRKLMKEKSDKKKENKK